MANPLILKVRRRAQLSDEELALLDGVGGVERQYDAGEDIVPEGSSPGFSCLLTEGFASRYKVLAGGERQISAIHVPGDFVDLHSLLLRPLDNGVLALCKCRATLVPHEALREITERFPRLQRVFWLNTLVDAAIMQEWLVSIGRRAAPGQLAHLICELYLRLDVVGLCEGSSFALPLTQTQLADALGLSLVHLNRTLQLLRSDDLVSFQGHRMTILDWEGLCRVAEFDPSYLHLAQA